MGCLLRFARGLEEAIQDTAIMRPAEEDSVGGEKPNPSVFHNSSAFSHCLTWKCGDVQPGRFLCFAFKESLCSEDAAGPDPGPPQLLCALCCCPCSERKT